MNSTYTTTQGDMWDDVAYKALGSEAYTGQLMDANVEILKYWTLPPGCTLQLPVIPVPEADSLPPWKKAAS